LVIGVFRAREKPKQTRHSNNAESHAPQKAHSDAQFPLAFTGFNSLIATGHLTANIPHRRDATL
jgi:hypothetical protein